MSDGFERASDYLGDHPHSLWSGNARAAARLVLSRVPAEWLSSRKENPILFIEVRDISVTWRAREGLPPGSDLVLVDHRASELPGHQLAGVLAHELAHIYVRDTTGDPTPQTTEGEMYADGVAASWGFGRELHAHLSGEVAQGTLPKENVAQVSARVAALERLIGA